MSDQDFEYPDDYQSPDNKQENSDSEVAEKLQNAVETAKSFINDDDAQEEEKESEEEESASSQRKPDQQKAAALDGKERAAMKWLNEGNALQPLLDDPPSTYRHKSVLYDLANRL